MLLVFIYERTKNFKFMAIFETGQYWYLIRLCLLNFHIKNILLIIHQESLYGAEPQGLGFDKIHS